MNWLERAINRGQSQKLERQKAAREAELAESARRLRLKEEAETQERAIWEDLKPDIEKVKVILDQFEMTPGWKVNGPERSQINIGYSESVKTRPKYITEIDETDIEDLADGNPLHVIRLYVETVRWYVSKKAPSDEADKFDTLMEIHLFTNEDNETFYEVSEIDALHKIRGIYANHFTHDSLISSLEKQVETIVSQDHS